jgi:hypothetical protein
MKASDRVVLIVVVTLFGYLILSHVALHAKWKRGDFVNPTEVGNSLYADYRLPAFKYLKLLSLSDCRLFPAVQGRLEIENGIFDLVKYQLSGDTLIVDGSLAPSMRSSFGSGQSPQKVKIYLPPVMRIEAVNSRLDVKGETKRENGRKMEFLLDKSLLNTRMHFELDTLPRYYDSFIVHASNRSEVFLFRKDHFNTIDVDLAQSNFYGRNAKGEKFSIRADSSSMVVSGGNDFQLIITQ